MITKVTHISILVKDQEEALAWYHDKLGFEIRTDAPMGEDGRWLTIGPPNQPDLEIVLQPAAWGPDGTADERAAMIGKGPGFVFAVDDCSKTYTELSAKGVSFAGEPEETPWGVQAIVQDLYGNTHVLVQSLAGQ